MSNFRFKKTIRIHLDNEKCLPFRKHSTDAGSDLVSNMPTFTIKPGEVVKVSTGVRVEIPKYHVGFIFTRSSMGTKHHITLTNDVGVIDADYRGELFVNIINESKVPYTMEQYTRFAQLVIMPVIQPVFRAVEAVSDTERGDGGFGSTDEKEIKTAEKVRIATDAANAAKKGA